MKKTLVFLLTLVFCFQCFGLSYAESAEWTCTNCGRVNDGYFCVDCGAPGFTPTPKPTPTASPTPKPTPVPTPVPETWHCVYCDGDNDWGNAYCRYCGCAKKPYGKRYHDTITGMVYYGMTYKEMEEACGGELPKKIKFFGTYAYLFYFTDSENRMYEIYLSVNNKDMSYDRFLECLKMEYGYNWTAVEPLGTSVYCACNCDEMTLVAVSTDTESVLSITPNIRWDNVKMGRELVRQERESQGK